MPLRPTLLPVLLAVLAVCGSLVACREPASTSPVDPDVAAGETQLDLVAYLPAAERAREVSTLDLGTPAARPFLTDGWGRDERDGTETFVWGVGESSVLDVFVARPRRLFLQLEGRAFAYPGAAPQTVTVEVNGHRLATRRVRPRGSRLRLVVPASRWVAGRNRIVLRYARFDAPAVVLPGSQDQRPLAVQWLSLELRGLDRAESPRAHVEQGVGLLELPAGSEAAYYLPAAPARWLVIDDLLGDGGRIEVTVRTQDDATDSVYRLSPRATVFPWQLPLPASGGVIRLGLRARSVPSVGGLFGTAEAQVLVRPRVVVEDGVVDHTAVGTETAPEDAPPSSGDAEQRRPNVLVYLIDTLRADHLGVYGYDRDTSPHIDRFAHDAVLFSAAEAQSSWTRPTVVSVLTGLLPQRHGVTTRDDALAPAVPTLATLLADTGFGTGAVVTNGNVSATFGLGKGFERYRYLPESRERPTMHQLADRVNQEAAVDFERFARGDRPFFLFLHVTDPHAPYTPPEPFKSRFAEGVDPAVGLLDHVHAVSRGLREAPPGTARDWRDLYDAEIAWTDHQFGALLDDLRRRGLYDDTMIVLVADHGEEFMDHGGWEHGKTLNAEQLRVPLLIKLPAGRFAGRAVHETVRQIDILPTVLDVLGLPRPEALDGASLLPLAAAAEPASVESPRVAHAHLSLDKKRMRSVVHRGFKVILDESRNTRAGVHQVFDVTEDPEELHNLRVDAPLIDGYLRQLLRMLRLDARLSQPLAEPEKADIDEALRDRLKALGYID